MIDRLLAPPIASLLIALVSAAVLVSAFALEHLGGLEPCQLCIWQRYPYAALIVVGLIGWRVAARPMLGLSAIILLGGAGLAAYHVGVEQGWWSLPAGCVAGSRAQTIEELRQLLSTAPPACDQVSFTFLGLSLAGWNVITSLALAIFAALALLRRERDAEPAALTTGAHFRR